jgi:hypothetical protein
MKLYKLRSLTNLERFLDIVLNERLYCAPFEELNDPFEGLYIAVSHFPPVMLQRTGSVRHSLENASSLHEHEKYSRICSLSSSFKDVRLWAHYADGHKGVAIEIDFAGHEADVVPIHYLTELKRYSNTILGAVFPDDVLRHKTVHWLYEEEVRILQGAPFYPIAGRITSVILGVRVSSDHKNILDKVLPENIPMIETKINEVTLEVEPNQSFHRTCARNRAGQ